MNVTEVNQNSQEAGRLRATVIDRLYAINDPDYLKALKKILDTHPSSEKVYYTNEKQKTAVMIGKEQILQGQSVINEELEADEDKWLNA
ncbi:MAG: hypothetical protein GY757_54450 [bacterium]|nr:hypothetical protein [bacterium]